MAVRSIMVLPAPVLRTTSSDVEPQAPETALLIEDMLDTLYSTKGVGLAAVQLGVPKRVVVVDLGRETSRQPQIFINPIIVETSKEETSLREGCLSIPDTMVDVVRPEKVTVRYFGVDGQQRVVEAAGILAKCLQHEIDHLNGILITDHGSPASTDLPEFPNPQD